MKKPRNVVGPQIMKLRYEQNLSQPDLAAKCQRLGWNIGRDTIAKIEDQRRWVGDFELIGLASALRVPMACLFPHKQLAIRLLANHPRPAE